MPTPASSRPADKKTDEEAATPDSPQPSKPGRGLHLLASPLRVLRHPGSALAGLLPRHGGAPRTPASRSAALLLLAAVSTLLFVLHRFGAGFAAHFEPAALRATFEAAGPVGGVVLYVAAFCVGELLHLPGTLFVAAGVLVWGRALGWLLAVLTAPVALTLPFLVVRRVGGQGYLAEIRFPLFRRILERLDARPLSTVLLLRSCFFMAPPATYALALSSVSLRNYMLGSMLGLVLPLTFICAFTEKLLYLFGYEAATGGLAAGHGAVDAAGLRASGFAAATGLLGDVRAAAGAALDAAAEGVGGLVAAGGAQGAADAADLDAGEQVASAAAAASANLVVRRARAS